MQPHKPQFDLQALSDEQQSWRQSLRHESFARLCNSARPHFLYLEVFLPALALFLLGVDLSTAGAECDTDLGFLKNTKLFKMCFSGCSYSQERQDFNV